MRKVFQFKYLCHNVESKSDLGLSMGKMEKNEGGRREGGKEGDGEREGGKECFMVAKCFVGFKWSMLEMEVSYQAL